jgi:4-amino-4-deoxy-L-arabinose transferase-like glycosyltransferase
MSFMFNQHLYYYLKLLCFILFVKAAAMTCLILYGSIGLGPDEAQYWTWSKALDWGYYSKPPGIAWQIWLGTQFFGDTELGVRFVTLIFSYLQSILIFFLCYRAGLKPSTSFWCALLMAFSPMGILGSLMAITDGGMLLFWSAACLVVVTALHRMKEPNPLVIGVLIIGGALFKWPMYLFWVLFLICRWFYFPYQKISQVFKGVLISLTGLLPSVWWNGTHDWATFRHVFSTIQGGQAKAGGNFLSFMGSQAVLISPIIFIILVISLVAWFRQRKALTPPIFFCGLVTLFCLGMAMVLSLFQKIQGNWVIFSYPTAFVVMGWKINEWRKTKFLWVQGGLALSLCMIVLILFVPLTAKLNPFKHNQGWSHLQEALTNVGYDPSKDFLFSDKYQTTSELSFYGPEQKRAYFFNLGGIRKNQFSYWPGIESEDKGKTGYFVWIENSPYLERDFKQKMDFYQGELKKYFGHVEFAGFESLQEQEYSVIKGAFFFKCRDCKKLPQETDFW